MRPICSIYDYKDILKDKTTILRTFNLIPTQLIQQTQAH